ncbi:MAG: DedA family protein [Candidatus Aenigmatarchaeota archaeon]
MIAELLSDWIISVITALGYPGIFFLMAGESACLPIPSEVVLPFAGYITYQGTFDMAAVIIVATLGQVLGSLAAYYAGAKGGRPLIEKYGRYALLDNGHLRTAEAWFERWGAKAIFIGRLVPIVRTFIAFPAGLAKMNVKKFTLYTLMGSLPFTTAVTYIGFYLGPYWEDILGFFGEIDIAVIAAIIMAAAYLLYRKFSRGK